MSWKNSIQTNPSFDLYSVDESHPNIAGSYLAACTFYSTLFNKSCLGSSYYPAGLSYSDATYLQNVASTTVLDSTFIWNMFDIQSIYATGDISFDFFLRQVIQIVFIGILEMVVYLQMKTQLIPIQILV